jgi:hypothetical protein
MHRKNAAAGAVRVAATVKRLAFTAAWWRLNLRTGSVDFRFQTSIRVGS